MEVFKGKRESGYSSEYTVDVDVGECSCCKTKNVLVMSDDNEYGEYFNGEYCEMCISEFFKKADRRKERYRMNNIINADRKQLLKIIRRYCIKCMGNQKQVRNCESKECDLYPVRMRPTEHRTIQTDVFKITEKEKFFKMCDATLETMPVRFFWSEFRQAVGAYPLSHNLWGAVAKRILKRGYRQTGKTRPSPITSTNGTRENEYEKYTEV